MAHRYSVGKGYHAWDDLWAQVAATRRSGDWNGIDENRLEQFISWE